MPSPCRIRLSIPECDDPRFAGLHQGQLTLNLSKSDLDKLADFLPCILTKIDVLVPAILALIECAGNSSPPQKAA